MKTTSTLVRFLVLPLLFMSSLKSPAALQFDGINDYVTFGAAPSLGVTNFTIECWFKRTDTGVITTTGTGGVTNGVPLVTKGRGQAEGSNVDMNWFLGISTSANVLAADFEDRNTGLNHPIFGTTPVSLNVWQHAAVTYKQDGVNGTWVLYLNGVPDKTNTFIGANPLVATPRGDSIQHAALASALTSTGVAAGFYKGLLDEVRVWNDARSAADILAAYNTQITSASGLIARWPLVDGTGTTATNSVIGGVNGTLTGGPGWIAGYVFPPSVSFSSPANGSSVIGDSVTLAAGASPTTGASVTNVEFYADAVKIGEDTTAPYTLNWCGVAPASYGLTAVVRDNSGASATSSVVNVTLSAPAAAGSLAFDGSNEYVTFGAAPELGLGAFTIECWFKRTGAGATTTTGTGGVTDALPLVSKGRGEAEGSNVDMNWFLGIKTGGNVLAADFEEGAAGSSPGLNHPILGSTPLVNDTWYHAAATYDGATWKLYLNGNPEANLTVNQPPRADSIQHAALASALTSAGTAAGFFQGLLDEVRVWNYARTATDIADNYDVQLANESGLIARWSLNEGAGAEVRNAVCGGVNGTLMNAPAWSTEFFVITTPAEVSLNSPANGSTVIGDWVALAASATPSSGATVTNVEFYADAVKIGEDATAPYTLNWCGVAPASYGLTAVVRDNSGASVTSSVVNVTLTAPAAAGSLAFDGSNEYVTFGAAPELGLGAFTIECWFKRTGAGVTGQTGSGGIAAALPLVTKGRNEVDDSDNRDMNWFLGISTGGNVLAADFEEGAAGSSPGLNHPILGSTPLVNDTWYHAAATYDGATWKLYLNGNPEANLTVNQPPRADSIQHAALASALDSSGTAAGFFQGLLDEVRVWNYARTDTDIADNYDVQLANESGLIARWSLNESAGTEVRNAVCGGVNGTLMNAPAWSTDFFAPPPPPPQPPAIPVLNLPVAGATGVGTSPTLEVAVDDPDSSSLTVTYYGRVANGAAVPGPDFTLVALPDTQFYHSSMNGGSPAIAYSQTQWIVDNRTSRNIQYLAQLGDCVQNGDNNGSDAEWRNATNTLYRLENPLTTLLPEGVPYGVAVGNHDQGPTGSGGANLTTTFYNQYFGTPHFEGYNYYGDHYGANNDNHYDLFSASGLDFIVIYFEYDAAMTTNSPVIAWADGVLQTYSNRRAIAVSHHIINSGFDASFSAQGSAIYNGLRGNTNLFLLLSGHVSPEEGQRTDTYEGRTVWSIMTDYQSLNDGGDGWLRLYEFSPSNNVIRATTYSPWLPPSTPNTRTGPGSQFDIPYNMTTANPFAIIGTNTGVPSGSSASVTWNNLITGTSYEWYAVASDGSLSTTSETRQFTTEGVAPQPPTVTLSLTGSPMAEAGGVATVTATLSETSANEVTVNLAFAGTATFTSDYTRSGTSIVIAAGNLTGSITLTAEQDSNYENPNETIVVDISSVVNAIESGVQQVSATITDDDPVPSVITLLDENFDSMGAAGTTLPTGWTAGYLGTVSTQNRLIMSPYAGNGQGITAMPVLVSEGSALPTVDVGTVFNLGTSGSGDRAVGGYPRTTPSGDQVYQVAVQNTTGGDLTSIKLSYWGEQWRQSDGTPTSGPEMLRVLASTTSPTTGFTYFPSLDFLAPMQTTANAPVGGLDGNLPANRVFVTGTITFASAVPAGGTFYVRWHDWNDDGTSDHFLGIDDVVISNTDGNPTPGLTAIEPFDSYANGTVITNIGGGGVWTSGANTVLSTGGVNGTGGLSSGNPIFNWKAQTFQWSTLADGTKVAMSLDFQSSPTGTFNDDRVGWTITPDASTSTGSQLALQLDNTTEGGMVFYHNATRTPVLNALSGIKNSTWYRFHVEFTKLTATSAGILGTLTELTASGNPTGTPYVGTIADTSTFANAPSTGLFTASQQCPTFKNFDSTAGNADNATFTITTPGPQGPTVTLSLTDSPMAEAGGVATVTATLSETNANEVTVNLAFAGTATFTSDYTRSGTSISIPAGELTGSITLTAEQDSNYENPNETIVVDISSVVNSTESGNQQVTATITGDDPAPPIITMLDENFDSMGSAGTALPAGWTAGYLGTESTQNRLAMSPYAGNGQGITAMPVLVSDGSALPAIDVGTVFNLGTSGSGDRAVGGYPRTTPSGDQVYQVAVVNTTGGDLTSIKLSYWGEQWRQSDGTSTSGPEMLRVLASTTSPTTGFTYFPNLDFLAPIQTEAEATVGGLDGNLPANRVFVTGTITFASAVPAGGTFYVRWHDWNDNGTSDHFLGIDDVAISNTDDDPAPNPGLTAIETFDSYANGTLLTAVGGGNAWVTVGNQYTVVGGGGVNGSAGLSTDISDSWIFNWKAQTFQWSTLADGTEVAISLDFQSSPTGTFDDDRVGWTITPDENTSTGSQLALQLDTAEGGMIFYHNLTRTPVLNALSGIKNSTWYRFHVKFTKLSATSAGIVGTLTELTASGNPTGTPYVGTIADTSAFANAPSTTLFTASQQCPSFKNFDSAVGNVDNATFNITTPTAAEYVIFISVDGLAGTWLSQMFEGTATGGPYSIPNLTRLKNEGAGTLNARSDYNYTITSPNNVSMVTGRGVSGASGHNWTDNGDPAVGQTIHSVKGSYVASFFDVAHDNGLRTGMFANKSKFSKFDTYGPYTGGGSYNATYGAPDTTGADNGPDKIDDTYIDDDLGGIVVDTFIAQQSASPDRLAFLHINEPDAAGHGTGWGNSTWFNAVVTVDGMLGKVFKLIEQDVPVMIGKTAIILTTDHGGTGTGHSDTANPLNYTIPFFVWGPGVAAGGDLYAMNPISRTSPGTSHPPYTGGQPIRNGDGANLALDLLGLGPVPGSTINSAQDLLVGGGTTPPPTPVTSTQSFTNGAAITIPDSGAATPYPSVINVSGMSGTISTVTVTLRNLSQTWASDVDALLVGPGGQKVLVMSDAGSGPANDVTLTLSGAAAASLPAANLVSGTFRPTNLSDSSPGGDTFPAPAPGGAYATALSAFNGSDANGAWSLYVFDDGPGDLGSFAGGWSLTITTTGSGAAVTVVATDATGAEPSDPGTFTFTRTGSTTAALTVNYTVVGTASSGSDYTSIGTTVTFGVGSATAIQTVSVLNDGLVEGSETVVLTLAAGSGYTVGSPAAATVTINDDDGAALPTVTVAATDAAAAEPGDPGTFTFSRTGSTAAGLTVNYTVGGTASSGSDYTSIGTTVTFGAGSATATQTVSVLNDALVEGSETVVLTLAAGSGYTVGSPAAATVTIADDEVSSGGTQSFTNLAAITIPDQGVGTPYPSVINVAGMGGTISTVTVRLRNLSQTWASDVDALLVGPGGQKVLIMSDAGDGNASSVTLTLSDAAAASLPAVGLVSGTFKPTNLSDTSPGGDTFPGPAPAGPYAAALSAFNGTDANGAWSLYVFDDGPGDLGSFAGGWSLTITTTGGGPALPTVTVAATDATAAEPSDAGTFTFTRTGSTTAGLTVNYTVGGTASSGSDYTSIGTAVTFGVGSATATQTVSVQNDALVEGSETVVLTLAAGSGYTVGSPAAATVTINDDDGAALPVVTVAATDAAGAEPSDPGTFTFSRTGSTAAALTVNYTVGGTASSGSDYTSIGTTVTFAAGSATATQTVSVLNDALVEGSETVVLTLAAGSGYTVGSPAVATVTIADDEVSSGGTQSFTNLAAITIPDQGAGTPYPSVINVSGMGGTISTVTVTLRTLSQTWASDVDALLVGPGGQKVLIMSDAGDGNASSVTLTLSDAAAASLPAVGLVSGTFKPTNLSDTSPGGDTFPGLAPAGPYAAALSAFNGSDANGAWSLYVFDDGPGDQGSFAGGWSLTITTTGGGPVLPAVTVAATDAAAAEPSDPGTFTFSRTGSTAAGLTVNYTVGGTASSGSDYTSIGTTVTFAAGSATATQTVSVLNDALVEGAETVVLTLAAGSGYTVGSPAVATVTIADDEVASGGTQSFTNLAAITIPDQGAATPYPSVINVAGMSGTISTVTVRLRNLSQTWASDVDVLLVGPGDQKVLVMSDAGSGNANNVTLTLSDAAAASLPAANLVSGTFKPTNLSDASAGGDNFPGLAAGPYAAALSAFNGTTPNGAWSLYVFDDGPGDLGSFATGWSLTITTTGAGGRSTISAVVAPQITMVAPDGQGGIRLNVRGQVGLSYALEASSDLVNWTKVDVQDNTTGSIEFVDQPTTNAMRFYRAVSVPK